MRALAIGLLLLFLLAMGAPVGAQDIAGYRHKHWDVAEGAPADIRAIAQTRDGYLWLGTSTGLYRFDGLAFDKIEPATYNRWRSTQITALAAAPDGALWVGYDYGGVGVFRDGRLTDANAVAKPQGSVLNMAAGADGDIWVTVNGRLGPELRRRHAGRWRSYTPADWLRPEPIQGVFVARDGTVWIAQYPGVLRVPPGATRPEPVSATAGLPGSFAEAREGAVWMASSRGLQRLTEPRRLYPVRSQGTSSGSIGLRSLLLVGDEAWIAGHREGLVRLPMRDDRVAAQADVPIRSRVLFRDREGTIWGGGPDGLVNYIRSPTVAAAVDGVPKLGFAVGPGPARPLFFATDSAIYRISGGKAEAIHSGPDTEILCAAAGGQAIAFAQEKLLRVGGPRTQALDLPRSVYSPTSCVDEGGKIIVSFGGQTILEQVPGGWRPRTDWPSAQFVASDGRGGLYANQPLRAVWHIGAGAPRKIWEGDAIAVGFVKLVKPIGGRVYIGGEQGLARSDGAGFITLEARAHPYLRGLSGIAIDPRNVWLIGGEGIVRIAAPDFEKAFAAPGRPIPHQVIGQTQGFISRTFSHVANDAEIDAAGTPWFVTNRGVVRIEADRLRPNAVPPPLGICNLVANGRTYTGTSVSLPAGTSRIDLDYVALSFTDPTHNRYRYRLVGFDGDWVDAGTRRLASYTALGPGTYRFQVIAANPDGVWNRTGTSMTIEIAPFFWQTWWFRAALVLLIGALVWLLVRWRVRIAGNAIRQRLEDRAAVREHIAQELHDTLLQGVQGLMLRFQSVLAHLPAGHAARVQLESTLERADDVLQEGRDRVRFLRENVRPVALAPLLAKTAGDVLQGQLHATITEAGTVRPVSAPVADDLARIASEAMFNALRHAAAATIAIRIVHGSDSLSVTISDDGRGMDPDVQQHGGRPGHYGLVGMRERAQRLGGTLRIRNAVPSGTELRVTVPARLAYR
ncbi:sensor histidine kinase [Polymorphobacter fuscus]|uniref:Two-component system NarL family,nitrate/nitrite sensor histidine kinase NarQ n=1 Tax=Sandarakinorhabdus fusca TaxID=1439888 RepID=A0A7C9KL63_9SPHN|nr:sensor histidine kinase [Polymorphobacter fuscus]KAB7648558.1 two-component system NarL family,nitrate/nitrite sensor histidine kinase NarQ [Polymorphobacter fuscus]MQT16104.1 two-component system NarL family,nitrate/nitrite sensor histidine kinase NarQ [Polymorphobacter fuscus]NJC07617.1 signal transduction histidine kinase/ligand-binding sensor domain-containing protein [Polymorphobacter fuscus]